MVPPQGSVGGGRVQLVGIIFFAHGSAAVDGRDRAVLNEVAKLHQTYGGIIRVIGHSSARTGTLPQDEHEVANLTMSLERASAVAEVLLAAGVPATALVTESRSDAEPVYHEFMPTGEAGNRRAEVFLEY